jgi:glycosyltransferase involved in cell wall biosynthesis
MSASKIAQPLVSIGLPVRNSERQIAQTIDSVLAQTLGDFELIVSDNASTDATVAVAERYMQRDPRIRLLRQSVNRGVSANWNAVARAARGRYFKWQAGNDLMKPELLEECVRVLEALPDVVLAYGRTRWMDTDGTPLDLCDEDFSVLEERPAQRFARVARDMSINNQINAGVIRTAALRRTRLLGCYPTDDLVLMAELALHGKVLLLPDELFRRRTGADVSTPNRSAMQIAVHHNPTATRPNRFLSWRRQAGRYAACLRAPLPLNERLHALAAATGLVFEAAQRRRDRALARLLLRQ